MTVKNFRELRIWQEAQNLTVIIYDITKMFPADEKYGLISQIRRSAASIAANIAEGRGRSTAQDYANFLSMAHGSAQETAQHCLLAKDLKYVDEVTLKRIIYRYEGLSMAIRLCRNKLLNKA